MKKTIILVVLLISNLALAESAKFTIEGMHCGGCKKMVTKSVCADANLSLNFESCEVISLDTKKQIGILEIKFKKDFKIEADTTLTSIEKAILAAGEDYKITKKEILK